MKLVGGIAAAAIVVFSMLAACSEDDAQRCSATNACTCIAPANCNESCGGDGRSCLFVCRGAANCIFHCPGGGCTFRCETNATCNATCAGGGCTMDCAGAKECNLDCIGNGCRSTCERTERCTQSGCQEGCNLTCGGAVTCTSTCGPAQSCGTIP